MLRINPSNLRSFIAQYKEDLIKGVLTYIPEMILQETDDKTALVGRILTAANANGAFKQSFGHRNSEKRITTDDIQAFARFILLHAGQITLKKPIFEPHAAIDKNGHIKPFKVEVTQIKISWRDDNHRITCVTHFVEGDTEDVETWAYTD